MVVCEASLGSLMAKDGASAGEGSPAAGKEALQQMESCSNEIPIPYLELLLDPLTQEELKELVGQWQLALQSASMEVAESEINYRQLKKSADATAIEEASRATTDRRVRKMRILERFNRVVDAYEEKGGDPKEYRNYVLALSATTADLTDSASITSAFTAWLLSPEGGVALGGRILQFVLILLLFWVVSMVVARVVERAISARKNPSALLRDFAVMVARKSVQVIGVMVALTALGVNVGAMAAVIGGGAFILGFALQDTLGNFASGFMLMIYRPFDVGDAVNIGGTVGQVEKVTLVNTKMLTFDNQTILIPNKEVWGKVITNITANPTRRVDLVFGISYNDNIDLAKSILEKLVHSHPLALKSPEPTIQLHELADSSMNFICRPWAKTSDYWTLYWDLNVQVKKAFDEAGISIPFPQRDVHLHQVSPS